jgi:hypothetical protein
MVQIKPAEEHIPQARSSVRVSIVVNDAAFAGFCTTLTAGEELPLLLLALELLQLYPFSVRCLLHGSTTAKTQNGRDVSGGFEENVTTGRRELITPASLLHSKVLNIVQARRCMWRREFFIIGTILHARTFHTNLVPGIEKKSVLAHKLRDEQHNPPLAHGHLSKQIHQHTSQLCCDRLESPTSTESLSTARNHPKNPDPRPYGGDVQSGCPVSHSTQGIQE